MNDISKYIETLKEFSEKKLKTEYDIDKLQFDEFGLINSYLIYQSIKDKKHKKNTLIYLSDKESNRSWIGKIFLTEKINFESFSNKTTLSLCNKEKRTEIINNCFKEITDFINSCKEDLKNG